ncbi:hypothetical protein CTEN210_04043 [Chaetoceros tenuissimus]|uniref:SET domain-containing protein n=1 Tax=Chaetoceros tenuissimus TaxID=426638 RepID=A0AAD3H2D8_9STRA|nr:hypothetical protein CTEN210_04043 [Chaetoceros tenuissimus]
MLGNDIGDHIAPHYELVGDIFEVKQSASGLGAYALKFLPKWTLILVEDPYLFGKDIDNINDLYKDGKLTSQHDDDCYLQNVLGFDSEKRRRIWQMHDQFVGTYATNQKRLFGILKSNVYFSTDEHSHGLYPIAARLNHSCCPNVGYGFDGWKMRMYTTRDVQPGEELYSCYSDVVYHGSRDFRQAYMDVKFNFECQCSAICSNGDLNIIKASDGRRSQLKLLSLMLAERAVDIKCNPTGRDLEMILTCISLLVMEGIDHNIHGMYQLAYETAMKLNAFHIIHEHKLESCCLSLLEVSKGSDHILTKAFRDRLLLDGSLFSVSKSKGEVCCKGLPSDSSEKPSGNPSSLPSNVPSTDTPSIFPSTLPSTTPSYSSKNPSAFPSERIPCGSFGSKGQCQKVDYCTWVGNGNAGVCSDDNTPQECLSPDTECNKMSNC